ncbi:MAG: ROK family protein [Actinomycetota bacterium]
MSGDRRLIGVDIGGSGIKAAVVDADAGAFEGERQRIDTPDGFDFDDIVATVAALVAELGGADAVGVGFPGVVAHGVVKSPPTAHEYPGWLGRDLAKAIGGAGDAPAIVLNDADAAGVAEVRFGAGRDRDGLVMIFTLGTGVGSAVFVDGELVPNTELGKLFLEGHDDVAELYMADRVRTDEDLSWEAYGRRLHEYFAHVDRLFTPDLVVIGGGVSKKHEKFLDEVDIRVPVVPAELRNQAGIVGAATAAASLLGRGR